MRIIVIFANSLKNHGRCVAGKDFKTLEWIRPVATKEGAALSTQQASYRNPYGLFVTKNLQKIRMEFESAAPLPNQPENWLISKSEWTQDYTISLNNLSGYLDHPESLWGVGDHVSYESIKNKTIPIHNSLSLVEVVSLNLYNNNLGKRRASFLYNSICYDLAVTDTNFDVLINQYQFPLDKAVLCVSLAEPWSTEGSIVLNCYKVVAAIYAV